MNDKKIQFIYDFIDTILSVFRMLLLSRFKTTFKIQRKHNQCIVLGNGPSLIASMETCREKWDQYDLIAVNHMAQSEQYPEYKPIGYVLCDPAFWFAPGYEEHRGKVERTYQAMLQNTDWKLYLYVPYEAGQVVKDKLSPNQNISVHFFNKTKFDGYKWLKYMVFDRQWGMVRPQNILNAVLMLGVYFRYERICLVGAETNSMKDVWVDAQNRVRIRDTHFYTEEHTGEDRILPVHMPEQCAASYHIFQSYWGIEQYAKCRGVKVFNLTPGSFIDAFEKISKL